MAKPPSWRTRDIDSLPAFVEALAEEIHYLGTYGGKLPRSQNEKRIDQNRGISAVETGDYFTRLYFGQFRQAIMHNLFTPTEPCTLTNISLYIVGGNVIYLGILPTGTVSFPAYYTPRNIDGVSTGSVVENPKILVWNTNITSSVYIPPFTVGGREYHAGVKIGVGETMYLYNGGGSLLSFYATMYFRKD